MTILIVILAIAFMLVFVGVAMVLGRLLAGAASKLTASASSPTDAEIAQLIAEVEADQRRTRARQIKRLPLS